MGATRSTAFDTRGYNRIAIVCSDMQEVVDFYSGKLGFPLVKTIQFEDGTQQFFFKVTESDSMSFIWSPNAPPPQRGVTGGGWRVREDEFGNRIPGGNMSVVPGAMHHLAFDVPLERMDEYVQRLRDAGVDSTMVIKHIVLDGGKSQAMTWDQVPEGAVADEFVNSLYFLGPDDVVLEFASYTRDFTPADREHAPGSDALAAARN